MYTFDDRALRWYKLGDFEHFVFAMLDVDTEKLIVVQGEHRLYEPDRSLKEIRPAGSYTSSLPGDPHREGAGDGGGVVFYSVRGKDGILFEGLDENLNVNVTLSLEDFASAYEEQKNV